MLATEDEHFFEHPGVDYRGVIRGAVNELRSGSDEVGGSTITQQVTRTLNVLTARGIELRASSGSSPSTRRWILAFRIEREFTKEEILELYLNTTLLRPAIVWRRDRRADVLRQDARRAHDSRDRDPGRHPAAADAIGTRLPASNARRRGAVTCCGA